MTLLAAIRRRPEMSQEQRALKAAWDRLEEEVRKSSADEKQYGYTLHPAALWSLKVLLIYCLLCNFFKTCFLC